MGIILAFFILIIFFIIIIRNKKSEPKVSSKTYERNYSAGEYKSYKNYNEVSGEFGERQIALILNSLPQEYYHTFNNIYLYRNGMTNQIDHVVISPYGIFVIETKNFKGWIYGNDNSEYWTENMYGKKYEFYNPIKQNYSHIRVLQKALKIPINNFIPIVVFAGEAKLKCKTEENVMYFFQLKEFIERFEKPIFEISDLKIIEEKLLYYNIDNEKIKEVHKRNVQQRAYQKKVLVSEKICPKCGGKLVERSGEYGRFLGCSNYPKCKFTSKLN